MFLPYTTHINNKDAPWLVLVNGLFTDQSSWDPALKFLKDFNILTYDGRGQGEGPVLSEVYSLDEQVSDLFGLIKKLKIEKFFMLGLSNGGRVSLKFSSIYPELVLGLVVCDSYGDLNPLLKMKLQSWLDAHKQGGNEHRFNVSIPWVWGASFLEKKPELVEIYRRKSLEAVDSNIQGLIGGALCGSVKLSDIKAKTLFVVGSEDLLTPKSVHLKMSEEVVNSKVEVVPGGHASIIENPESIQKIILPFLEELV